MSRMEQEIQDLKLLVKRLFPPQNTGDKSTECSNVPTSSIQLTSSKGETSTVKKSKEVETSMVKKRKDGETSTVKKRKKVIDVVQENMSAPQMQKLQRLHWFDDEKKVVANANLQSTDPTEKIHCVPLVMDVGKFGFVKCSRTFRCIGQP